MFHNCIYCNLINQIDKYSDFLPWCKKSKIISDTNNAMIGVITVSKNFADWTFTTKNNYIINKKIDLRLVDGPFSHLSGCWNFSEINKNNTLINFNLEYEFSNKIIELTLKPVFSSIMSSILDSFISEAFKIKNE